MSDTLLNTAKYKAQVHRFLVLKLWEKPSERFWNRVNIIQLYWLLHNFGKDKKEIHINPVLSELLLHKLMIPDFPFTIMCHWKQG